MATLVLTTVGTALGGPIGGALGAMLGGAIDRQLLFKTKGREGPRLADLAVQTSTYGAPIPRVFGTMRVAGTVIWSTELIERASGEGGGKRGPAATSYSYSASFAVLLSARAVRGVRRIWADGKLLRGEAGDWKTATGFRLHLGGEEQAVDPLIASVEGEGLTPAHRGQAYAVFEDLALADFGNRIPSLTFEVEADDGPVAIGAIAQEASGGLVGAGDAAATLGGYAVYGASLRAVVDGLAEAAGAWLAEDGERLVLRAGHGPAEMLGDDGAGLDDARGAVGERAIAAADTAPKTVSISYHDAGRDYQTGLQRAERPGAGTRASRLELPAVLDARAALALAAVVLARADVARERRRLALDWRGIATRPGARVRIAGEAGLWRVAGWRLEAMVLRLELVRVARASAPAAATPGRATGAPDLVHGPTTLVAFEIPPIDDAVRSMPMLTIAAAGASPGWRSAALSLSTDRGASWSDIGRTRGVATLGQIAVPAGAAGAGLIDRRNVIEVTLAHPEMMLADADGAMLDGGANLALTGDELIQFGRAERIGPARWRLSTLLRGRRGTEWAIGAATAGDRFVLLAPGSFVQAALPSGVASGVRVMGAGIGDGDAPPEVAVPVSGASTAPPAPVHFRVRRVGGDVALSWVRRSRAGWRWVDGVDAPLAEEREAYVVSFDGAPGLLSVDAPGLTIPAGEVPTGASIVRVRQVGALGLSRAAEAAVPTA
jgi:hypothetical protein